MTVITRPRPILLAYLSDTSPYGLVREYLAISEKRGCIVARSDTCFGVFAVATDPDAVQLADELTGRRGQPFPVVVPSIRHANRLIALHEHHQGLLRILPLGSMTMVADARRTRQARYIRSHTNPHGTTLGVRVTRNTIESRLSDETECPIVSTAVRYPDGSPVRNWEAAWRIVCDAMVLRSIPSSRVAFVQDPPEAAFRFRTQSTVGRLVPPDDLIEMIREGIHTKEDMDRYVRRVLRRSWDDPETWDDVT